MRLTADPDRLRTRESQKSLDAALDRAASILRDGGLVALPTETVYGLGANALDRPAVERIFAAKGRPAWDPVIVHIASMAMLESLVSEPPEGAEALMKAFWPGPLTLLLPRSPLIPDVVTAGRPLVGIRMPAHPVALELIRRAGVPVAAPSANLFAHISPTTADHVLKDLDGRIDAVLDAGPTAHGVESTVLDPGASPMVIYRPGAITMDQIRAVAGSVAVYGQGAEPLKMFKEGACETAFEALPSPGVGLRHYAPRARLMLVDGAQALIDAARAYRSERVGIMLPDEFAVSEQVPRVRIFRWGRWSAPEEMAHLLYAGLRALDSEDCSVILCPLPPAEGIGAAIRDRLRKAAHSG